jgi:predicted DsbA family dithiol-disulfide isomerase
MEIKILGKTSTKRDYLITVVQTALFELGMDIKIAKEEDNTIIQSYGIKLTPALLIDEKIVIEGSVPAITEIKKIIRNLN